MYVFNGELSGFIIAKLIYHNSAAQTEIYMDMEMKPKTMTTVH